MIVRTVHAHERPLTVDAIRVFVPLPTGAEIRKVATEILKIPAPIGLEIARASNRLLRTFRVCIARVPQLHAATSNNLQAVFVRKIVFRTAFATAKAENLPFSRATHTDRALAATTMQQTSNAGTKANVIAVIDSVVKTSNLVRIIKGDVGDLNFALLNYITPRICKLISDFEVGYDNDADLRLLCERVSHSLVVNLSGTSLSPELINLLGKGGQFSPTRRCFSTN